MAISSDCLSGDKPPNKILKLCFNPNCVDKQFGASTAEAASFPKFAISFSKARRRDLHEGLPEHIRDITAFRKLPF
jgi:hypothetical protein